MPRMCLHLCLGQFLHVPDVSAKDPESSGIEQQPRDKQQQVEVGVHCIYVFFPDGKIVITGVDQGPVPRHRCIDSHSAMRSRLHFSTPMTPTTEKC